MQAASKSLVRISGVYGGGSSARVGRDKPKGGSGGAWHRSKARSTTSNNDQAEELPNATALARFAIERERLAREMGMEELGSPATLEVVNVGVRRQTSESNCRSGTSGKGHARKIGGGWKGEQGGGEDEQRMRTEEEEQQRVRDSRSASEILLEKLESVAEARSLQVRFQSHPKRSPCCFIYVSLENNSG